MVTAFPLYRSLRIVAIVGAVLLTSLVCVAQEPVLTARLDSTSYRIGSWITVHIDAKFSETIPSIFPAMKDSLGSFEILKIDSLLSALDQGVRRQEWIIRMMTFDSGTVAVPPIPFAYRTANDSTIRIASSNPLVLTTTGIEIDPRGDIRDIKPPMDAPWAFEDFIPYIVALLIIGISAYGYHYYRKRKIKNEADLLPPKPAIPPAYIALAALRELEEKRLWQQGYIKQFYSEVTEIIRRFLEHQFGFLALESTSDEIMQQLKRIPEARVLIKQFQSFFTTADLVKFAKYEPAPVDHDDELRCAYEVVRAMMPRITEEAKIEQAEVGNVR
ncbi:MAG: hypothetical protein V1799_18355 [bacterium]